MDRTRALTSSASQYGEDRLRHATAICPREDRLLYREESRQAAIRTAMARPYIPPT